MAHPLLRVLLDLSLKAVTNLYQEYTEDLSDRQLLPYEGEEPTIGEIEEHLNHDVSPSNSDEARMFTAGYLRALQDIAKAEIT